MEEITCRHNVTIENRNRIIISEVDDVESFDEEKVVVYTSMGTLTLSGYDFKINKLNVDDGQLIVEGEIFGLEYSDTETKDSGKGFFGKLFR
ncbi:MAG: sporulation protein YabP [Oscillospiraceae bacterium]